MNRKLLVSLLRKNIEELDMITESFIEMNEYPLVIIKLARRKTEDIQSIIDQLTEIKIEKSEVETNIQPVEVTKSNEQEYGFSVKPVQEKIEIVSETLEETKSNDPELADSAQLDVPVFENIPEIKIQPVEKSTTPEPEFTIVMPQVQAVPEIETVEFETLVENAKQHIKSSTDFGFSEDLEENLSVVTTEDEMKITVETKEEKTLTEITKDHEIKLTTDETRKTTIAEKIGPANISRNEKLSKIDNSLSASLANRKITDIKQAISIGDRFRFQRELFNGNGEEMNKTLHYINQLASYEEVMSFLTSKYNWDSENEAAEDFNQIVKRKFN